MYMCIYSNLAATTLSLRAEVVLAIVLGAHALPLDPRQVVDSVRDTGQTIAMEREECAEIPEADGSPIHQRAQLSPSLSRCQSPPQPTMAAMLLLLLAAVS